MPRLDPRERASLPDRAFAYIDSQGRRRLPIHDPAHVRNALVRFGQVGFESEAARERSRSRVLTAPPALWIRCPAVLIRRIALASSQVALEGRSLNPVLAAWEMRLGDFFLAIGSVRGFALFLGISTILDLFVAYFFMHLKFDKPILTRVFYAGVLLALAVYVAVLTMFKVWYPGQH